MCGGHSRKAARGLCGRDRTFLGFCAVIKTAHLRVYLPADRLEPMPEADTISVGPPRDLTYAITALPMSDDAHVAIWQGQRYLCPRTPRLRMLEGVLAVRNAYSNLGTGSVIPERVAIAARSELDELYSESPALRSHILTSAWHIPIRWFVPFMTAPKEIVGGLASVGVRYRCDQRSAMVNLDWAVEVLSGVEPMEQVVAEVRELRRWLGEFPTTSMAELDYGSVGSMFSENDLVMDDSVDQIQRALSALDRANIGSAVRRYDRVVTRWASLLSISASN